MVKEDEKRVTIGGTVPRHETPIVPVRMRGARVAQVIVRCRFSVLAVIRNKVLGMVEQSMESGSGVRRKII